ncbi:MAG: tagatose 1,6-diphosphate aldolase GatY/KbaY [Oceanotoga sp.]|jgi:tagatose 1,6-diphosphate aldolase GatY/KbaY|uniref:Tagatose-bisphosphate aldolase catalytic subunit n=1 Tax=Oceanotoga teriensis TaxID=515440 RepID=A0AA45HIS9_9BACT|nr:MULTISPECIES: tagatose-bisphosphate aldolase subunit GatY [Oceanotoga]MDN5342242.1 tagatose 1,6-diphosphate aldolase GatY/KbaY [Oceanotoga sp.]PWJ93256.1 tagatose-bisphosphate aldolase catalytic subunit [Oceanotoga teriensis]
MISSKEVLEKARNENYAVPAFNIHNLENFQVVVESSAELRSPVIIAATPGTVKYAGAEFLIKMAEASIQKYKIPIILHLDHFVDKEEIKSLIRLGFGSVMIDASMEEYEKNIIISHEVSDYAHNFNATVEAELGKLGGREEHIEVKDDEVFLTNPDYVCDFINRTNIDSLAVAIGTAHGLYKNKPKLDFERLKTINKKVNIPLVLHGASDLPDDDVIKCIEYGINKVNIATELKVPFSKAVRKYLVDHPDESDPRNYMTPGKEAMRDIVIKKIKLCGSEGKF